MSRDIERFIVIFSKITDYHYINEFLYKVYIHNISF